jgi:hypothetical protein
MYIIYKKNTASRSRTHMSRAAHSSRALHSGTPTLELWTQINTMQGPTHEIKIHKLQVINTYVVLQLLSLELFLNEIHVRYRITQCLHYLMIYKSEYEHK